MAKLLISHILLQVQTWSFRPPLQNTYTLEPTVTFWPVQSDGRSQSYLTLKVVGAGAEGFIEVQFICI